MAKVKLTKDEVARLGRISKGQEPSDPRVLEAMADRLLQVGAKQKRQTDYPILTERQRRRRLAKEVPLGGLIELVSANPAARFPIGAQPLSPAEWRALHGDGEEDVLLVEDEAA